MEKDYFVITIRLVYVNHYYNFMNLYTCHIIQLYVINLPKSHIVNVNKNAYSVVMSL